MCVDPSCSPLLLQILSDPHPLPYLPNLMSFFLLKPMKANVCCPDIPQFGDFPIECGQLTRGYTLKRKQSLHLPEANGCQ